MPPPKRFEVRQIIPEHESVVLFSETPTSTSGSGSPYSASVGVDSPTEVSMFNFS